jgi:hypothetical protein
MKWHAQEIRSRPNLRAVASALQVYGGTTGAQTNAGPIAVTFPVRVLAHSKITLTIPVSNPDNRTYQVNLQVQGG